MADHYYTNSPELKHQVRRITVPSGGREYQFDTDAGVFSKQHLDPGTALLLRTVGPLSGHVADLGCGWGPIGIILACQNPAARFVLADVNERAVALAASNAALNGADNACAVVSDGLANVNGPLCAVVSNPPIRIGKQAMYGLFAQSCEKLAPGGRLWIVIRKQQGAPSAQSYLAGLFGNCQAAEKSGGYWILTATKEETP